MTRLIAVARRLAVLPSAAVVALGAATLLSACGAEEQAGGEAAIEEITVAHIPSTLFAPLYVAQEKGYFAKRGLKVRLQTVKSGQDAVPLASSGRIEAAVAGFSAGIFNAIDQGLKIKIVGSMATIPDSGELPTGLYVRSKLLESGEVKTVADLKGRKVAIAGGAGATGGFLADLALRQGGLTLDDIKVVELGLPDQEQALKSGAVDAAQSAAPFSVSMKEQGVAEALAGPPAGTGGTGIIYGEKFIETAAAKKFFEALVEGAAQLQGTGTQSPETLQILADATGLDLETLRKSPPYAFRADLAPSDDMLQKMQKTYLALGGDLLEFDEPIASSEFVDRQFATAAAR